MLQRHSNNDPATSTTRHNKKLSFWQKSTAILLAGAAALAGCASNGGGNSPSLSAPPSISSTENGAGQTPGKNTNVNTSSNNTDAMPQPGDTKEVDGRMYEWVVNDQFNVGFYVPQGQQEKQGSGAGTGAFYYTGIKDLPFIILSAADKTYGDTPIEIAEYWRSNRPGCQVSVISSSLVRLDCPDSDRGSGYIDYRIQNPATGTVTAIEVARNDGGSATYIDQLTAANALNPLALS